MGDTYTPIVDAALVVARKADAADRLNACEVKN
jgi:hypothetical protein